MIFFNAMGKGHWLIFVLCFSASVNARHIQEDFDLQASAAEPRPIYIETGPSAEALPLVYNAETSGGPLTDASEKVEKVLRPALSFSYNEKDTEDGETAESKHEDQKPEAVDYYKYIEDEEKKERAAKDNGHHEEVEAGGEIAESKHHGHKHEEGHKDKGDQGGEFEKGGGKEFHAHHDGEHGEKGEKGYKGHHHHEKAQKGHHDHEDHNKAYDEKGGHQKDHHHKDGYHGEHHKSHNGKKGSKYAEKGEHNKGHSTRGSHSVHKKDEFEKKTEFFDEDHEGGDSEKHGGFSHTDEYHKGGHHKGGHHKGGDHEEHHGKKEEGSKGGHYKDEKGHNEKGGHEVHHDHDTKYGKKESDSSGKKWAYKEGTGGGGGGHDDGKHDHGAHSHQSIVVQAPPEKEQVAEASPVRTYELPPISAYILPLEGEPDIEDSKGSSAKIEIDDKTEDPFEEDREFTENYRSIGKKVNKNKKRPTPTDDYLADSPYGASKEKSYEFDPSDVVEPSTSSTISPIERLIRKSLIMPIETSTEQEAVPKENAQPAESKKITKRRRLKKRKIQKDAKTAESSRSSRAVPDCLLGHKRDIHIPGESSHNFVIVAADDAQ